MLIIGITGGTGCGKTTVVNQIIKELSGEEVTVISQDSYYKDLSHLSFADRTKINFDHPNSIDFEISSRLSTIFPLSSPIFKIYNKTDTTLYSRNLRYKRNKKAHHSQFSAKKLIYK